MKTAEERLALALENCSRAQLRMTPVRRAILAFLAARRIPVTLEMVAMAEGVNGQCDSTTVYRTLILFKEAEIARLVGTPQKTSRFILNVPDESGNFLICRRCGDIVEFPLPESVTEEINRVAALSGFISAGHDHEIHGLCRKCQAERERETIPCKLTA